MIVMMAIQLGPIFLECTWDDLTFYKWEGDYFVRKKSRLTSKRVKTSPEFALTMTYANLLATASQIASSIYSDLPVDWRQFWMFRSFTGEAMKMMEAGSTPQEAYDYLWTTYVEYWMIYQQTTGIPLKTGRTAKHKKPKTYKTRLKHRTCNEKIRRYSQLIGKNHWKSSYDHTQDILQQERKDQQRAWQQASLERMRAKEKAAQEEEQWKQVLQEVNNILQRSALESRKERPVDKEITCPEYTGI